MKILVLDNYDSFTYNLVHYIDTFKGCEVEVFRNDKIKIPDIEEYDKIILSPGPGLPDEAGILKDLIREYAGKKSIFGVCLGMQAIAEVFGGTLENLETVYHGVETKMFVKDNSEIVFKDIPEEFHAGRYHSWVVSPDNFPECLKITAVDEEGQIMALSHLKYDLKGVQFHPESVLTPHGKQMLRNFIES